MDLGQINLVLLDRDGVINQDSPDYIKSTQEWRPLKGAIDAIVQLQRRFKVAVCTNQSGVARGLFDEETLAAIHDKLNQTIEDAGGDAVDVFYCPHAPHAQCPCRKPNAELLIQAMRSYNAQPSNTLYVGDSEKDVQAAINAGCTSVLVLTGNGAKAVNTPIGKQAGHVVSDLPALAKLLNVWSSIKHPN